MKSAIRKMGNSHGVIIPKPLLAEIGAKAGDEVDLAVKGGKIVIAPPRKAPPAAGRRTASVWPRRAKVVWPGPNSPTTTTRT